jgi:hypothetical protein
MENETTIPGFLTQPAALSQPLPRKRRKWLPLLGFGIALAVIVALIYLL